MTLHAGILSIVHVYNTLMYTTHVGLYTNAQSLFCDSIASKPICPGAEARCTCVVTGTNSNTRWELGGNVCKGGLISLAQYPPCAGRGVPSSIEWCGSLVAFNEADPQGAGYCQMSTLIVTGDHTLVQGVGIEIVCRDMSSPSVEVGRVTLHMAGRYTLIRSF